jgi:hypothetical protein
MNNAFLKDMLKGLSLLKNLFSTSDAIGDGIFKK